MRREAGQLNRLDPEAVPVCPAGRRVVISTERHRPRAFRKVFTTGRIGTIRKLDDKNILRGFDLSKRAIVPIVSLVKSDPA